MQPDKRSVTQETEEAEKQCKMCIRDSPKAKLTGREKQKLNTQIDHLVKASDKLCEYEKSLDIPVSYTHLLQPDKRSVTQETE